ncbi:HEPN-associated N-terminal domain-containing protein [Subtercola boreus]|uniref:HEPN-associated N-terminal domain-containing protein n=1 Tax=Subtercola boreus TaxID=120213 RepID=UPI0011C02D11|nr:HEPN-associated N-terminal domain-containing protein [Subtercola boreus]
MGKIICSTCVDDVALGEAIRAEGGEEPCDYCGRTPVPPEASAAVEVILALIVEGFEYEYEDPVNQVLYSSADGGFQMGGQRITADLLMDHGITEDEDLFSDLQNAIVGELWVQRDPYAASPVQALQWGWSGFRDFVKHQRRYTFLIGDDANSLYDSGGEISMARVPSAVADAVRDAGHITVLKAGATFWRIRPHSRGEVHKTAAALASIHRRSWV